MRRVVLPDGCGFEPNDIPSNVDVRKENGTIFFEVVIKMDGVRVFRKKTTKSKKYH